jgi:hypothetical protein
MKIPYLHKAGLIMVVMLTLAQVSCARKIANVYPLDRSYYRMERLIADMNAFQDSSGGYAKLQSIGDSNTGRNAIYALQIQTGVERIPVLIIGQHHGEEVLGVEIALDFARTLALEKDNPNVQSLLDKYAFWIVPTLNPDAWDIVTSGTFQWKRKNNADTDKDGRLVLNKDGVDLNRNYPIFWDEDLKSMPASPYYKGSAPASENEVKAIIELASKVDFRYAFFYHSSISGALAEQIYLPWQDKKDKSNLDDFKNMHKLAKMYAAKVHRDYVRGTYKVYSGVTSRVGNARNYFYHEAGVYAMDIEVGGNSKLGVGVIHPRADVRESIVRKNVQALISTLLTFK